MIIFYCRIHCYPTRKASKSNILRFNDYERRKAFYIKMTLFLILRIHRAAEILFKYVPRDVARRGKGGPFVGEGAQGIAMGPSGLRGGRGEWRKESRGRRNVCEVHFFQGRTLITDDKGFTCRRANVLPNGCCNQTDLLEIGAQFSCESCEGRCCAVYEYCVSCCLKPEQVSFIFILRG